MKIPSVRMSMRSKALLLVGVFAAVIACSPKKVMVDETIVDHKQELSTQLTQSVLWYQLSNERKIICQNTYEQAAKMMRRNVERYSNQGMPLAVILDIDETVLDNSPYEGYLIKNGITFTPETWSEWVNQSSAQPIPGAVDFVIQAADLGVEIFYVSNRSHESLEATMLNLQTYDLPFVDPDHIMLKIEMSDKTERREQIKQSHKVIFSVGDQLSDFTNDTDIKFTGTSREMVALELSDTLKNHFALLPNPMYGDFTKMINPDKTKDDALLLKRRMQMLKGMN